MKQRFSRISWSSRSVWVSLAAVALLQLPQPVSGQHHKQQDGEHMKHHTKSHDFADAERWSEMFDSSDRDDWQKPNEVVASMEIAEGMTVADIGAGTGYFLSHLSAAVGDQGKVLALDVEASMVEFMTARSKRESLGNVHPSVIPYTEPGLEESSADRVLIVNTWHHIDQRSDYARKLEAALRPEGRLYIVDFTKQSAHGPPPEQRLTAEEVIAELEAGGLEAETIDETLPDQYIVVARSKR